MRIVSKGCLLVLLACLAACSEPTDEPASKAEDYTTSMSHQHAQDTPVETPAAQIPPAAAVQHEEVVYALQDGREYRGYLVWPKAADGALPGIIMFHEWWGLNDNIRAMADRLAAEGYVVLAPNLYGVPALSTPEDARKTMMAALSDMPALTDRIRQAYRFLQEQTQAIRIGTVGWCFGGSMSLLTATLFPQAIDATVLYYGNPAMFSEEEIKALQMPVLGLFGGADESIPLDTVQAFEKTLAARSIPVKIKVYEGADHAFANPSGTSYQPQAAADAWNRTVEFFEQYLHVAPEAAAE